MRFAFLFCLALGAPVAAAPPVAVQTRPLAEIALHPVREASAQVVSLNLAKLSAEIPARIERIAVEPGQRIARGAVVAELDCADHRIAARRAQATLESAQARLALARQQLQRARELASQNFISSDALDAKQAEVGVLAAETRLAAAGEAAARRDVGKCTLKSPYPAIVEARLAQVGEWASPGTPVVQLWDTSRLQLAAQVQVEDAESMTQAQPVFVSQGREVAVKLLRLSPALNPASRTREARFAFPAVAPAPGSHGVLRWRDPRAFVPPDFVVRRNDGPGVFVVSQGRARFVPLPGAQEGRPALAAALDAGTRVVTEGRFTLQDGMAVTTR
ncbi:MAG: efflux RND transporter periplasmic adaptor subunit [Pseudomonadota bacterium]